jgi:mannosyl-3-phosphoglycerate phosphatase
MPCRTSEKDSGKKPLKNNRTKIVVFTDLDGTLLDEKYDYRKLTPIISQLLTLDVAIVFCSSKTRAEIEFYREKIGITDPFIAENGAALFIPKNYFPAHYSYTKETHRYYVIELSIPYSIVRKKLTEVKMKTAANIVGFGDMTLEEIAEDAALSLSLAKLAKKREYDEPFKIVEGNEKEILNEIKKANLSYTKGNRYFHVVGDGDKGKATLILRDLYAQKFGRIATFGLGDSSNDLAMLQAVDTPFLVRKTPRQNAHAQWKKLLKIAITQRTNTLEQPQRCFSSGMGTKI